MAKKTEAEIDAEVAAELAAEAKAAAPAAPAPKQVEIVRGSLANVIVKIGLVHSFQIIGGDVYTFLDAARHRAVMTSERDGVKVTVTSRIVASVGRQTTKTFLVPWPNVTYVLYGDN